MTEPVWISRAGLEALHAKNLAMFGGLPGLRDENLLESALARPVNLHVYTGETDVAVLAASYGFGLARNHPFCDGNKRAALLSIGLFLGRNGYRLTASQPDTTATILALAAGEIEEAALAAWIRANMTER